MKGYTTNMFKELNPDQLKAIQADDGPVLVIAGAGSGKTSVLTQRVLYLIENRGILPENILAVTFTNKAAKEIKDRIHKFSLSAFYDQRNNSNHHLWIGTFHAICARILHHHIKLLGFKERFNIYDQNDSIRLIKKCLESLDLNPKQYKPKIISSMIERAKNHLIDEENFDEEAIGFYHKTVSKIYQNYQAELLKNQALDFGDIIHKTVQLLQTYPKILEYYQAKFQYILIDEYQDINHAQYILIHLLSGKHQNLFVVGDPDQSIYRFRGAELSNIIHFEKEFPICQVIKLEQNYRSSEKILRGASFVIRNNLYRKEKELWTSRKGGEKIKYYEANSANDEAEFVANEIMKLKHHNNMDWNSFVILYRTNAQSRPFEEFFARNHIPFKIFGGIRFYERKEIKDLIYLLKLIDNPQDQECCYRWLEMDKMGIGKKGFQKLAKKAEQENKTILEVLPTYLQISGNRICEENKEKIEKYLRLFTELRETRKTNISLLLEKLIKGIRYYERLSHKEDQIKKENRIENVKIFLQSVKEYEKMSQGSELNDFLTYVSLISATDTISDSINEKVVQLMTLHCAKGLEFPVVFLTGLEEGIFPHNRSIASQIDLEEERRLCYVGMTRAMERLYLTYSWRRNIDGRTKFNQVSRFFHEIPAEYLERIKMIPTELMGKTKKNFDNHLNKINLDDWIYHPDWGKGSVLNKKEAGNDDCYITVHFQTVGIKRLSLKYAPIKKIEKDS